MKQPTHTGTLETYYGGKVVKREAQLIENKVTWRDAHTGQRYGKTSGCVRPCNLWDRRTLDLTSIEEI